MLQQNRAYSTEFSAHRGLISRIAYKGYVRLQQAGVSVELDDVFQEMSLIYVKAAERYDATKGFTFGAYLGQALWHDFNKYAEKLIIDRCGEVSTKDTYDEFDAKRAEVSGIPYEKKVKRSGKFNGIGNLEAMTISQGLVDGGKSIDPYDILAGDSPSPEEQYINSRAFTDAMKALPATERVIVGNLIRQVIRPRNGERGTDKSLAEIMRDMKLSRKESVQARELIGQAFGVNLKGTK